MPIPQVTFNKTGYLNLNCEIHNHMKANIIVVDSPYFTTTSDSGRFKLSNIPSGEYTIHAQLDAKTKWKTAITVKANQITSAQFPEK